MQTSSTKNKQQQQQEESSKSKQKTKQQQEESANKFWRFQLSWLCVYYVVMGADWLQGPVIYALYHSYGFNESQIAYLFITGYFSSMLFGTIAGSLPDKFGRKWGCICFGLIYSFSCLTKLSLSFEVLIIGRIAGGIGTSLLFSVFESWMVHEHKQRGFSQAQLQQTFSLATFGNGVAAILAGVVASHLVEHYGLVSPFMLSLALLVIATLFVMFAWKENYGDQSSSALETLTNAVSDLRADKTIALLGLIQSLFEGAMYTFVFMWTPMLQRTASDPDHVPLGIVFSTFMACTMMGSCFFSLLIAYMSLQKLGQLVLFFSACSMLIPVFYDSPTALMLSFCLFELCCGLYWPCFGSLRGHYIPERSRSATMNLFRVPLNLLVVFVLIEISKFSPQTPFAIISGWLALAFVFQIIFSSIRKPTDSS